MSDTPLTDAEEGEATFTESGCAADVVNADFARDLERRLQEAQRVLVFYAAPGTWQDDPAPDPAGTPIPWTAPIWGDEGQRARDVLAALAEKGKP